MEGEQPLVGLVSGAAEKLYARLAHAGGASIGTGPSEVDLDSPVTRELFDNELTYWTPVDRTRVHVVSAPALPVHTP